MQKVKAVFVSHEHGDHIHGIPALSKKFQLPVYITPETLQNSRLDIRENLTFFFRAYEPVQIGNLSVTGFPKFHDARDPHSFIVSGSAVNVGIFTDIGQPCEHVTSQFKKCHAAFLESNYDEVMLEKGGYPYPLKTRIRGGKGHLSNTQALDLFLKHKPPFMSHLFLSHLSRDNNRPKLVKDLFDKNAGRTEIIIAPRDRETRLYPIRRTLGWQGLKRSRELSARFQLSLFQ